MRRTAAVLILGVAILAGACSSDDDGGSAANTSIPDPTTTASTTTEPRTVAPDIIPDDVSQIDEAYVEGVLEGLAEMALQALESTRDAGVADENAIDILTATRTSQAAADGVNSLAELAREGFVGYRPTLEPTKYQVTDLLTASGTCIVAQVTIDASGYFEDSEDRPGPPGRTVAILQPASNEQVSSGLNPTAWVLAGVPVIGDDEDAPACDSEQ